MKLELLNTSRKGWVDALRGLAILLVIYGHSIKHGMYPMREFFVFTSPFKMPLFFAITGYVFVLGEKSDTIRFFSRLFKRVFVPWMVLGMLPELVRIPFSGVGILFDAFFKLLSGKSLWFMPCFFIGEIVWYFSLRVCKKTVWITIVAFLFFIIGLVLNRYNLLNYAMFNRALTVQPFFYIGYLFRKNEQLLTNLKWHWLVTGVGLYIGLCLLSMVIFPGKTIDVHLNRYYNIPFCLLLIYLSCFLLFAIASKCDFKSSLMSFIGQNTLVLYIWHSYFILILVVAMSFIGWEMPINWWTALIKVVWSCVAGGICAVLLNRYLPFVVGKTRNKQMQTKQEAV